MHAASSSFSIELNHLAITKKMASALRLLPLVLMSLVVSVVATKSPGRPLFREYIGPEGTNVTFAEVPVHPGGLRGAVAPVRPGVRVRQLPVLRVLGHPDGATVPRLLRRAEPPVQRRRRRRRLRWGWEDGARGIWDGPGKRRAQAREGVLPGVPRAA
jgi:hypothetical protein